MIKRLIQAYKLVKAQENKPDAQKAAEMLLNDPMSLELIAKMATRIDRGFEIVRPSDGFTLRFIDKSFQPVQESEEGKYW